ncbi:MAG: ATP-binding protein [Desulfobacteraceae bacterium]|nr:MAG: ATP-binding protein [Desulfobacteraceae bacterium]
MKSGSWPKLSSQRAQEIFDRILKHGEDAINEFIAMRENESLFLDFKLSSDNGSGTSLHQNDRNHLARAISGFGNSEGGVLIWGVDCRKGKDQADVAQCKSYIVDPRRFCSWLENAVSGLTMPPHTQVENKPIFLRDDTSKGFAVTYVPKSDYAPHQVIASGKGQYHYYIRAGSTFSPTPHSVLAGMFGRRPQPSVFHLFALGYPQIIGTEPLSIKLELGLQVTNSGPGVASDLFMTAKIYSKPGENCELGILPQDQNIWTHWAAFGTYFTAMSKQETRLPPDAILQPFVLSLVLKPPFTKKVDIEGICGCGNAPSFKFRIKKVASEVHKYYFEICTLHMKGLLTREKMQEYQGTFWETEDDQ